MPLPLYITPMSIRLIALDLDGTLLTPDKQIHPPTAHALQSLAAQDIKIILASARPPRSVRPFYSQLALDTLQINYNGALIHHQPTQSHLHHQPMPGQLVLRIIIHARTLYPSVLASLEVLDRWYTDYVDPAYLTETARHFQPDSVAPIHTFCDQPITKLMLLAPLSTILGLEQTLKFAYPDNITLTRCDDHLLQIMDHRAGKAAALTIIAAHYQIPLSDVLAIGDAPNDLDMLQAAGHSAAVANAHDSVKNIAQHITPSPDSQGVLQALRHFGLCA